MQLPMKTKIVYSEKCLGYGAWHIEGPQRVKVASEILKAKGYEFLEPKPASEEDLLAVHDAEYLWKLKKGLVEDADTPAYDNIYEYASLSVGRRDFGQQNRRVLPYASAWASCWAKRRCFRRSHPWILLPKQHRHSSQETGKKTLILDIDGHHGNGTQEIFQGDDKGHLPFPASVAKLPGNRLPSPRETASTSLCRLTPAGRLYLETLDKALGMVDFGGV